jgi:hypothetical protein
MSLAMLLVSNISSAIDLPLCASQIRATELTARQGAFSSNEAQQELAKADCDHRDVYCVDASGYPVPGEERDPDLKSGQVLTLKLFGPSSCQGVLAVGSNVKQSDVRLFRDEGAEVKNLADDKPKAPPPPLKIELLSRATVTTDAATEKVTVVVSRVDVPLSLLGIELDVSPPRYFLDVGLLVSFTPKYQTVSTSRAPGSSEVFIREEEQIHPSAAITLNYFPFGQYAVPRFSDWHGLGIQAGIGADFSEIDDEFYVGLIWEPIPGAGISGGLAMLSMQRLQPDYPEGALVSPSDVPKDEFLGPRAYFGISLNTQVFQTVLNLGGKARVPN